MHLQQEFQHAHALQAEATPPGSLSSIHNPLPIQRRQEDRSLVQAKGVDRKPGHIEGHVIYGSPSQSPGVSARAETPQMANTYVASLRASMALHALGLTDSCDEGIITSPVCGGSKYLV